MTHSLDSRSATFFVLVNAQGQHSLWPDLVPIPEDWNVAFGGDNRDSCLEYIEQMWVDRQRVP